MKLERGTRIGSRFELGACVHADDEGEDYTAKDLEGRAYVRVRVLAEPTLADGASTIPDVVAAVAALEARGIPRALAGGVDRGTARVWFAEDWLNGKPITADTRSYEALEAFCAAAPILDPLRSRGIVHGRLAPALVLENYGEKAVVDLAAGMWLGQVRPLPGNDLGQLGRWLTRTLDKVSPAQQVWCARCEQGGFASFAAAIEAFPITEPTRAERAAERERENSRRAELLARVEKEAVQRAEEAHRAQQRDGLIPPPDLPAEIVAGAWPQLLARVAPHVAMGPYEIVGDQVTASGLTWRIQPMLSASAAWTQARALLQISHVLASTKPGAKEKTLDEVANSLGLSRVSNTLDLSGLPVRTSGREARMYRRGMSACIEAHQGTLQIGWLIDGWVTSHLQGQVMDSFGSVALAVLPRDATALGKVIAWLLDAASVCERWRREYVGTCQYCQREFRGVNLHSATVCHGCAERHLGVIY